MIENQENTRPLWACLEILPSGMLGGKPSERRRQIPLDVWAELGSFTDGETADAGTVGRRGRCPPPVHPEIGRWNRSSIVDGASKDPSIPRL